MSQVKGVGVADIERLKFDVGEQGAVPVRAIDLPAIQDTVEGHALYQSLLDYVASNSFAPEVAVSEEDLLGLLLK